MPVLRDGTQDLTCWIGRVTSQADIRGTPQNTGIASGTLTEFTANK